MLKEEKTLILILLILFFLNYSLLDKLVVETFEAGEEGIIERVIDGDTVIVNGGSVRLLGINSPEKEEEGFLRAKEFLEGFNGSRIKLEFGKERFDKYGRSLAYVFYSGRNLNLESVREGYSNPYFPKGKEKYYFEFFEAWDECMDKKIGICEGREENCLNFEWVPEEDYLKIENVCFDPFNLEGYLVKDEGRKKYIFGEVILEKGQGIVLNSSVWGEDYVWTKSGDSLFVRNSQGELIYFDTY